VSRPAPFRATGPGRKDRSFGRAPQSSGSRKRGSGRGRRRRVLRSSRRHPSERCPHVVNAVTSCGHCPGECLDKRRGP
jgi:hypothetical protein